MSQEYKKEIKKQQKMQVKRNTNLKNRTLKIALEEVKIRRKYLLKREDNQISHYQVILNNREYKLKNNRENLKVSKEQTVKENNKLLKIKVLEKIKVLGKIKVSENSKAQLN